jgi:hypothetical protein
MSRVKHNFILAFPGMGKTPLAHKSPDYADADFGNYRTIMNVDKADEDQLLEPFSKFMKSLGNMNVLTNEPKLSRYIKFNVMYLPKNLSFSAKKMGVPVETIAAWVKG